MSLKKVFLTREVRIGPVVIGGNNPVCIQSMTNTATHDVAATVDQIKRLSDAGCQIVRVTVQGKREALACKEIKENLIKDGYTIALVADIHFYPPAALLVAEFVDKVRINPGNFLDKRASFKKISYTDQEYQAEIEKIYEGFSPLVEKCKRLKRALRVGVNHGSLSDRIMNRFGDNPEGMCESALEYLRVCVKLNFFDVVVSMKSSNVKVMVAAYRLLVKKMIDEGMDFPLHLGVTEAGPDIEGRVKSSCGIGSLLIDGIGDTIRVSLTEDPEYEIEPAKKIARLKANDLILHEAYMPKVIEHSLLHQKKSVFMHLNTEKDFLDLGFKKQLNRWMSPKTAPDLIFSKNHVSIDDSRFVTLIKKDKIADRGQIIIYRVNQSYLQEVRAIKQRLVEKNDARPLLVQFDFPTQDLYEVSAIVASLVIDNVIDGFCINMSLGKKECLELSFLLLQASRDRLTRVELIACPGCGRTLFNLQEVTQRIKKKTEHFIGVKIAVMGCIVNGPGEMADADFGYVGSGRGKIDLYKGQVCVEKGVDQKDADERLLQLIECELSMSHI